MEPFAQAGAHTAPPLTKTQYNCMCLYVRLSLHLSQPVLRYGRSPVHEPNVRLCVCVGGHSLTPSVDTGAVTVQMLGCVNDWESHPACPFAESEY